MDEQIEPIYKKFNYPNSVQKLLKLVKKVLVSMLQARIYKHFWTREYPYNRPK